MRVCYLGLYFTHKAHGHAPQQKSCTSTESYQYNYCSQTCCHYLEVLGVSCMLRKHSYLVQDMRLGHEGRPSPKGEQGPEGEAQEVNRRRGVCLQ